MAPSWAQALVSSTITRSRSRRSDFFTATGCLALFSSDSIRPAGSIHARSGGVACALTTRTSLPRNSKMPSMPSSLPSESQSGRTWLVRTTRLDCRKTSSNVAQSNRIEAPCVIYFFALVCVWPSGFSNPTSQFVAWLFCSRFQIFHTASPETSHGSCTIWEARRTSLASCNVSSSVDANF